MEDIKENKKKTLRQRLKNAMKYPTYSFYTFVRYLMRMVVNVFFKDITIVGEAHIPMEGPVIFCGNHQN
jgi:1-acyl-sn-glycerol-3-phosphate acyltransferase